MTRAALALAVLLVGCAATPGPRRFVFDDTPQDVALDRAIDGARATWQLVGAHPPMVTVIVGRPPGNFDGMCYGCPGPDAVIVVRYRRRDIIAHELGHAMGLEHVTGADELMAPTIGVGVHIGPATLAEARRVHVLR